MNNEKFSHFYKHENSDWRHFAAIRTTTEYEQHLSKWPTTLHLRFYEAPSHIINKYIYRTWNEEKEIRDF